MKMLTNHSTDINIDKAIEELLEPIFKEDKKPDLLLLTLTVAYDVEEFYKKVKDKAGNIPFQGGTTHRGVMTDKGIVSEDGRAMSVVALWEEDIAFGTAAAPKGDDPRQSGIDAVSTALKNADRDGELPSAVWLVPSPGGEEQVLEGIKEVVGGTVPLIGGSSADNTIEGKWYQFTDQGLFTDHITLVVIFRDDYILSASFHSGYDVSDFTGVITKSGDRVVHEIDNKPAADVYNDWSSGAIDSVINSGGPILELSNLYPLGRKVGSISGMDYYLLSHPETVTKDRSITLFTDIKQGEVLSCMNGTVDNLINRAGHVVQATIDRDELSKSDIEGVLIIFCAGCMGTIGDRMDEAYHNIRQTIGENVPFWTMFTFGEQGSLAGGENKHGNLMISVLVFSKKEI